MSENQPSSPAEKPSTSNKNRGKWILAGIAVLGIIILLISLILREKQKNNLQDTPPSKTTGIQGIPPVSKIFWDNLIEDSVPLVWLEVNSVAKVRKAAISNQWLQQVLQEPLGRGFVGSWFAFLGTRGKDIQAQFGDTVANIMFDRLLTDPLQLFWFSANKSSGTPALVIPSPSISATTAYSALDAAITRQIISASCNAKQNNEQTVEIKRWLLGEHALYASKDSKGIILSRSPLSVLQAICTELPKIEPKPGVDASLVFQPKAGEREMQFLATLLGIGKTIRLEMAFQNQLLIAKGIYAPMAQPKRLGVASLPLSMLRAIPANTPVVLTLQLQLPKSLSLKNLQAHFQSENASLKDLETRQIAILWTPHGDKRKTEIGILWSKTADAEDLKRILSGPNAMTPQMAGGHLLMTSTNWLEKEIRKVSLGKAPSLLDANGTIVSQLKTPASLGLLLQPGPLLSNLLLEGFPGKKHKLIPAEINAAQRHLQDLSPWGFFGTIKNDLLIPKESDS